MVGTLVGALIVGAVTTNLGTLSRYRALVVPVIWWGALSWSAGVWARSGGHRQACFTPHLSRGMDPTTGLGVRRIPPVSQSGRLGELPPAFSQRDMGVRTLEFGLAAVPSPAGRLGLPYSSSMRQHSQNGTNESCAHGSAR